MRVWRFRGNGLKPVAGVGKDLDLSQGEAFPRWVGGRAVVEGEFRVCWRPDSTILTRDPGQEPGLSFLSATCVRVTPEEPTISDDYHQVISKAFSSPMKLRHCPPKMLWKFSNLVSIRITCGCSLPGDTTQWGGSGGRDPQGFYKCHL